MLDKLKGYSKYVYMAIVFVSLLNVFFYATFNVTNADKMIIFLNIGIAVIYSIVLVMNEWGKKK